MAREPDPFRECRPGGTCPDCCAPTYYCGRCEDAEVENRGDVCADCWEAAEDEREHEGETIHDTWAEARGEV